MHEFVTRLTSESHARQGNDCALHFDDYGVDLPQFLHQQLGDAVFGTPDLRDCLKCGKTLQADSVDLEDDVAGLDPGQLGRSSLDRGDDHEVPSSIHLDEGPDALKLAFKHIAELAGEHIRANVRGLRIPQCAGNTPDRELRCEFGVNLLAVDIVSVQVLPSLPDNVKVGWNVLGRHNVVIIDDHIRKHRGIGRVLMDLEGFGYR